MTKKTDITSRAGFFTSSQIWQLMTNGRREMTEKELIEYKKNNPKGKAKTILDGIGAGGLTYIDIKRREKKLGRQIHQEKSFKSAAWGTMMQHRVLNLLLSSEYKPVSDKRFEHPVLPMSGSPDFICENRIGDIKCFELDNFTFTHDIATQGYEKLKEECPDIFWQLVSNAILCEKEKSELILYVPYTEELKLIRDENEWSNFLTPEQFEDKNFKWWINSLAFMEDSELPYLIPNTHYPNLSSFIFYILESDKTALTNRVIMAMKGEAE